MQATATTSTASRQASDTLTRWRCMTDGDTARVTVRCLLDQPAWQGARLLSGAAGLDCGVRFLNVMTVPDIVRWTKPEELLITTSYPLPRRAAELCELFQRLSERGVSAFAVKLNEYLPELPSRAVSHADALGLPLISIPDDTPIDDLLAESFSLLVAPGVVGPAGAQDVRDKLLKVVLSGGGLGALVHELSGMLGGAVVAVVDASGNIRATAGDTAGLSAQWRHGWNDEHPVAGANGVLAVAPVHAGNIDHGWVVVAKHDGQSPEMASVAVERGAVIAALEMTRDLAVLTVERQFAYETLRELVTAPPEEHGESAARALRFGWDLERSLAVLVADLRSARPASRLKKTGSGAGPAAGPSPALSPARALDVWMKTVRDVDARAAIAGSSLELLAVVDASVNLEKLARRARDAIADRHGWRLFVGVSNPCVGATRLPRGYQEARTAVRVASQLMPEAGTCRYASLGLYRLFHELDRQELELFVEETLGPLLHLPGSARDELMTTLEVILEGANVAEAARRLHYHYNTMRYRITKLEALLGNFTVDADARVALEVGIRAMRFLDARGRSPLPRGTARS